MEAMIQPPQERIVTLMMPEKDARILMSLAPNITFDKIQLIGGNAQVATEGHRVFAEIFRTLHRVL